MLRSGDEIVKIRKKIEEIIIMKLKLEGPVCGV